jgi:hypothetical protein
MQHGEPPGLISWLGVLVLVVLLSEALKRRLRARSDEALAAFDRPEFVVLPFGELPAWARARLARLQADVEALGFRPLVAYRRNSTRVNWSSILVSADGRVLAHLWVARRTGLLLWATLLLGWRAFWRDLRASPRYSLVSLFEGERRFVTSRVEILANATVAGQREYVTMPRGMSLADARHFHEAGAAHFATRGGYAPVAVTTAEEFLDHERELCRQLADRLRARRAATAID